MKSFVKKGESGGILRVFLIGTGDISSLSDMSSISSCIGAEIEFAATTKGSETGVEIKSSMTGFESAPTITGPGREPVEARLRALFELLTLTLGLLFDSDPAPVFTLAPG